MKTEDNFTSFFPIWIPIFSLIRLTSLARTFSTMLNKRGESGHSCLVPDAEGRAFNLSPLSMMLAVGLANKAFIVLKYIPSVFNLLRDFMMKGAQFS